MAKLDGKTAVVTGASSGIGAEIAKLFAFEGARVAVVGRNGQRTARVADEINAFAPGHALPLLCDVRSAAALADVAASAREAFGDADILVNCAGVFRTQDLEGITEEAFSEVFETNAKSVVFATQALMPQLVRRGGSIVNIASIAGLQSHIAGRSTYLYAASKAAVIEFSQLCALNYSDKVRVNCICPGPTDTPLFTNRDFSRFHSAIPMGRMGQPEDVARAALFLASQDAAFISGAVLTVDGAASLL